jgi:hypothetical protein
MTNECVSVDQAFTAQRSDETLRVRVRQCENTHMKNYRLTSLGLSKWQTFRIGSSPKNLWEIGIDAANS